MITATVIVYGYIVSVSFEHALEVMLAAVLAYIARKVVADVASCARTVCRRTRDGSAEIQFARAACRAVMRAVVDDDIACEQFDVLFVIIRFIILASAAIIAVFCVIVRSAVHAVRKVVPFRLCADCERIFLTARDEFRIIVVARFVFFVVFGVCTRAD